MVERHCTYLIAYDVLMNGFTDEYEYRDDEESLCSLPSCLPFSNPILVHSVPASNCGGVLVYRST